MGLKLNIVVPDINKFYFESNKVESTGNQEYWEEVCIPDPKFTYLAPDEIERCKYSYKKGLKELERNPIKLDLDIGGSKNTYKWDEFDGDDMSMERYYEGIAPMKRRIKTIGTGTGKIINLNVCICENAYVKANELMMRARTTMRIIDLLESMGYRVGVNIFTDTGKPGTFKDEIVDELHVEVCIKKPEEPLNKGLIFTAVSPWMFRYHMFKFRCAKIKTGYGNWGSIGHSLHVEYESTKENLYICNGECLDENSAEEKIQEIGKLFKPKS